METARASRTLVVSPREPEVGIAALEPENP
jgi:hypothetical protein